MIGNPEGKRPKFRNCLQLLMMVTLAILIASAMPAAPEAAATAAAQDRVELDDGNGTLILARGADSVLVDTRGQRARRDDLPAYVPDANATSLDPGSLAVERRLGLDASPLSPPGGPAGSVIGVDNRKRVRRTKAYPASAATFIYIDTDSRLGPSAQVPEDALCSGALVAAANLVVTAAHCVYDARERRWFDDWTIYPGAKKNGKFPYGSCSWRRVYVHKKWQRTGNPKYDVAAIVLDCNVGNRTGWFGARASSGSGYIGGEHVIHQYPGDKPLATQWRHQGTWAGVDRPGQRAFYPIDTAGGSSGSAVIQRQADGGYYTNATHAYGVDSTGFNSGATWWKQPWKKVLTKAVNWATRTQQ